MPLYGDWADWDATSKLYGFLAEHPDRVYTAEFLSSELGTSIYVTRRALRALNERGLLRSGPHRSYGARLGSPKVRSLTEAEWADGHPRLDK